MEEMIATQTRPIWGSKTNGEQAHNGSVLGMETDETRTGDMVMKGNLTGDYVANAVAPTEKKKISKDNVVLKGISLKKRLEQALVSPRKKNGTKEFQIGDGLYSGKPR